jgi:hypothetical protein
VHIARRLVLIAVLLAFPVSIAGAQMDGDGSTDVQGQATNAEPCTRTSNDMLCTQLCANGSLYATCPCFWDDPTNPNGFPQDNEPTSLDQPHCTAETPCCWNRPCHTFATETDCTLGGGGRIEGEDDSAVAIPDRCAFVGGVCGCAAPLVEVPQPAHESTTRFGPFDCYLPIDHFTFYKAKTSKGADKFVRFGPIVLSDAFQTQARYQVTKPAKLGLASSKNGEAVRDPDTDSEEYLVKPFTGEPKFAKRPDVHVVNQCNDLFLEVTKPVSLIVPTAQSAIGPVAAPGAVHDTRKHFLCYQAKSQAKLADGTRLPKFAKGTQVEVADEFQTRRYDLLKVTKLCNPVDVAPGLSSGTAVQPTLLSGPSKGTPKPITAAGRWSPDERLVCYQARLATKLIAQAGCGAADPADKGTPIVPAQVKHTPIIALHAANQFGAERLDTIKEAELCIPSQLGVPG